MKVKKTRVQQFRLPCQLCKLKNEQFTILVRAEITTHVPKLFHHIKSLMKKLIVAIVFFLCLNATFGQTNNVVSHDKVTIITDPSTGSNSFKEWGVFPDKDTEVRRIIMKVTLAYPQDRPIAHWDYMDRIKILRKGGVKGKNMDLEIGRMLTPYGSNFKKGWSYTWKADVTDFSSFLRDSVEIEYIHTGYESPDLGWD